MAGGRSGRRAPGQRVPGRYATLEAGRALDGTKQASSACGRYGSSRRNGAQLPRDEITDRRVYLIDDDPALRVTMRRILTSVGIYTEEFASAEDFLQGHDARQLGCMLLDVRLPGMSGLDLLPLLKERPPAHRVIVVSGEADIPLAVSAVRRGAVDVLRKPFRKEELLNAVAEAFRLIGAMSQISRGSLDCLTRRERQVLLAFCRGDATKAVAATLTLSARTVEMYRTQIVKKLGVSNMMQAILRAREAGYCD